LSEYEEEVEGGRGGDGKEEGARCCEAQLSRIEHLGYSSFAFPPDVWSDQCTSTWLDAEGSTDHSQWSRRILSLHRAAFRTALIMVRGVTVCFNRELIQRVV
jgi:hypothetical protein